MLALVASCGSSESGSDAGADSGACTDKVGPTVLACTDALKTECQAWAQSLVRSGVAHATCGERAPRCINGDLCFTSTQGITLCACGPNMDFCGTNICVSDPPGAPARCVAPCTP
jgi:hypothetical protein